MNKNPNEVPRLVELSGMVDEIIRFNENTTDRREALTRELFRQGKHFYMFQIKRSDENYRRTLKELHSKTFFLRKQELLSKRPYKGCEFWSEGDLSYKLKCRGSGKWKAQVDIDRCFFLKETASNQMFAAYQEALKKGPVIRELFQQTGKKDPPVFKQLSDAYDIDYENVVCLGINLQTLKNFKQTYQHAIATVQNLPIAEQYRLYKALSPGKPYAVTKEAIKQLQIDCGNADLRQMNFSRLIFALKEHVDRYRTEAIQQAIDRALSKEPEEQKLLYQKLNGCSNQEKATILRELGINPDALDVKKFNITPLKKALAQLLDNAN